MNRTNALIALALAGCTSLVPGIAEAQGLFERLFGPPKRRVIYVDEFPPAPQPQKRAKQTGSAKPLISAPSYYTYRADPLVKVDFVKLAAAPQDVALAPDVFRESVPALASFDLRAEKPIAAVILEYYSKNPAFLWVNDSAISPRASDAMRVLSEAYSYGLSPEDYAVIEPRLTGDKTADGQELMRFEMALTAKVLRYIRDANGGRVDPNRISGYYDFPPKPIDLGGALAMIGHGNDIRPFLESYHPKNPQYQALRDELAGLRASVENEVVVDGDLLLKPGQTSAELPKLVRLVASRLDDESGGEYGETLYRLGGSETYTDELVTVFKAEQEKAGLKADGVIGPRTVKAIAGVSKTDRMDKVLVALEQLRWLPSEFGNPRVWINQPAYKAEFIENETPKLSMRAVVGKTSNQTSFFYDEIEQVDYNPYWGVPQSIIVNEMLPRLRRDPGYLDRAGYEVFSSSGKRVPSSSVDWGAYGAKVPYAVRQVPSEANALGELKILFPNKHAIYMHDTPQKQFFDRDMRALSHGCIRLQDPRGMAAAVLGKDVTYVADKLSRGHSMEKTRKIPVYVSYFTAWPEEGGKVEYYADVYGRDDRLRAALASTEAVRNPEAPNPNG